MVTFMSLYTLPRLSKKRQKKKIKMEEKIKKCACLKIHQERKSVPIKKQTRNNDITQRKSVPVKNHVHNEYFLPNKSGSNIPHRNKMSD